MKIEEKMYRRLRCLPQDTKLPRPNHSTRLQERRVLTAACGRCLRGWERRFKVFVTTSQSLWNS